MADEVVAQRTILEFVVTVLAILVGLVIAKYASGFINTAGIPIAAGNPIPVTIPGGATASWRK